ncbi:Oidioi.mRNA.OKI2018_I69.chr1.g1216.t1.cds [Oikopleura dioica]|uniref:Oidioi.mRNA.OKI2018_I69.chr1.g1216.t1.cds n=1 Tax=Oikopleura dioica TaxID=34765 RepID=A0ABN7SUB0_OIKDI|nr:Oidioi.mRNA.OKI2018_I69.chr1.g1216.t1.cds [Oikopleura dioica]
MQLKDGSKLDIVRIRNPWGKTEWEGDWGDNDEKNWRRVSAAEKKRLKMDQAADDGAFWMTFKDWVDEFEILTICALPGLDLEDEDGKITKEEVEERETRVIGTFHPGVNAPSDINHLKKVFLDPEFTIQVEMDVHKYISKTTRLIWLQVG